MTGLVWAAGLSCSPGPQLPSATSAPAGLGSIAQGHAWLAEATSFLENLATQDRSGPPQPSAPSPWCNGLCKALSGGWAEVCIFS